MMRKITKMQYLKKTLGIALCVGMMAGMTACGNDAKVIEGNASSGTQTEIIGGADETTEILLTNDTDAGWTFQAGDVTLTPDMDMSAIADQLGEPKSYFEAASCAFEGLDKIYTYASFEIETYPQDTADCIKSIVLKDDTVSTVEGVSIGDSEDKVRETYGVPSEESTGRLVYQKEKTNLVFVVNSGVVISIEYASMVLE